MNAVVPGLIETYTANWWSEEYTNTHLPYLLSTDIQFTRDPNPVYGEQVVGLRFLNIRIPQRSSIVYAYVQFTASEVSESYVGVRIAAQKSASASNFTTSFADVSSRPLTTASSLWTPYGWSAVLESNVNEQTSNIAGTIQEVVNLPQWTQAVSPIVLVFARDSSDTGSGSRWASNSLGLGPMPVLRILHLDSEGLIYLDLDC